MISVKRFVSVFLASALCMSTFVSTADAAGKNSAAGKAYARAIANGTIEYNESMNYNISDIDGDGVKDLFISGESSYVFSYKGGKVTKILNYFPEYSLVYDSGKKIFWESGEGDGSWSIALKYKNGTITETYRYMCEPTNNFKKSNYFYQKKGEKRKKITEKKYRSITKRIVRYNFTTTKAELIKKLKKL